MARTQESPTDDPFYRRGRADRSTFADDALPLGDGLSEEPVDDDDPQQFRRASKRVPVRRGALARKTATRVRTALLILLVLAALAAAIAECRSFALHSGIFRVRGDQDLELAGDAPNSRAQVMEKMHEVLGRNIFQISLAERKQELEKIPWVESAMVIRLLPNRIRVVVKERTPVAFVALGRRIALIDAQGVVMEMPPGVQSEYSFPVITGMSESEPLSTRAPRMQTFMRLTRELDGDASGAPASSQPASHATSPVTSPATQAKPQYSRNLEEVDLSDPGDVKIMAKGGLGPVLLHLGNENFLPRFMVFLSNVQKWEQERGKLESVDLRYGREVILNPDMSAAPSQPAPAAVHPPAPAPPPAKSAKPVKAGHRRKMKRK